MSYLQSLRYPTLCTACARSHVPIERERVVTLRKGQEEIDLVTADVGKDMLPAGDGHQGIVILEVSPTRPPMVGTRIITSHGKE